MQVVALIGEENGVYGASFPDFPGCVTTANDPDEVLAKAAEVLALHISGLIAEGHDLPHVRPLSRLVDDRTFLESSARAMVALVPYSPTNRPVNLNITIDETLLVRIDQAAHMAGESRSTFLAEAARQRLTVRPGPEERASEPRPRPVEAPQTTFVDNDHHAAPPTAEEPQRETTPRTAPVATTESFGSADSAQPDMATSLATIREILEHLDQSGIAPTRPTELRPAKRSHA